MSAPVRTREAIRAGDKYARYECDRCGLLLGRDGIVVLTRTQPQVVWETWCPEHAQLRLKVEADQ